MGATNYYFPMTVFKKKRAATSKEVGLGMGSHSSIALNRSRSNGGIILNPNGDMLKGGTLSGGASSEVC